MAKKDKRLTLNEWIKDFDAKVADHKIEELKSDKELANKLRSLSGYRTTWRNDYLNYIGTDYIEGKKDIEKKDFNSALEHLRGVRRGYIRYQKEEGSYDETAPTPEIIKIEIYIDALENRIKRENEIARGKAEEKMLKKESRRKRRSPLEGFLKVFAIGGFFLFSFIFSLNKLTGLSIIQTIPESTNNSLSLILFFLGLIFSYFVLRKR